MIEPSPAYPTTESLKLMTTSDPFDAFASAEAAAATLHGKQQAAASAIAAIDAGPRDTPDAAMAASYAKEEARASVRDATQIDLLVALTAIAQELRTANLLAAKDILTNTSEQAQDLNKEIVANLGRAYFGKEPHATGHAPI